MQVAEMLHSRGYRLGPRIGKGSYAKVKVAERIADSKIMAAKIVNRRKAAKEFLAKFLPRELSVVLSVRHRNIIQVFEMILTEDVVCVMMEYAGRGDLLDYIKRRGALKEEQAGYIYAQVCDGVNYLHDRSICHRDLKCENVLLRWDMTVALSDFGFSRTLSTSDALSTTYCGSAAYASPELLRGMPYKPLQNDIWSLGCILFIMVTGQMPFYDKNTKRMMYRQLKGKVNFPEQRIVSPACKNLISNILEPNTDLRFNIKAILVHHWLQPFVSLVNKHFACCKSKHPTDNNPEDSAGNSAAYQLFVQEVESKRKPPPIINRQDAIVKDATDIFPQDRNRALSPEDIECSKAVSSKSSYSSLGSEGEHLNSGVSDNTSLCRMPGEECIVPGFRDNSCPLDVIDEAPGSVLAANVSRTSTDNRDISDSSTSTNLSNSILLSSVNTDHRPAPKKASRKHDSGQSTPRGINKNSSDRNFKMNIQKLLQVPYSRASSSKCFQEAATPTNSASCSAGKSWPGSQDSSYCGQIEPAQSSGSSGPVQSPTIAPKSSQTNTTSKSTRQDITAEQIRVFQEGLVTQMRRIFESKDVSTTTAIGRTKHYKGHG